VLEVLREPLESGKISVSRAARQAEFPARFQLLAAMNPCPCGFLGHYSGKCHCTPDQVARYRNRISGPLLDRIDLHVEVPAVPDKDLGSGQSGEASAVIRARVAAARTLQIGAPGEAQCPPFRSRRSTSTAVQMSMRSSLPAKAIAGWGLSARAYHRILKVARTVADLKRDARHRDDTHGGGNSNTGVTSGCDAARRAGRHIDSAGTSGYRVTAPI
jgi:magnesium chelatase family protein